MNLRILPSATLALTLFVISLGNATHAGTDTNIEEKTNYLEQRWAEVTYQLQDKAQLKSYKQLLLEVESITLEHPESANVRIWSGIIKSTYAGIKGGLGALKLAKSSKRDFEKALSIDPNAMLGSSYVSLGALYLNVPSWPISFGNNKKAKYLLEKGIVIDPYGLDSNFFYADYLIHEKHYHQAKKYLTKATNAPSRPGRTLADAGRRKEIRQKLLFVESKL
ncbi:MAG: hypothetical protein COB94_007215 [Gammaproteobacteria bacterium]|nr:hypothetical protein [Gammaproteobacteria bacterium]